MLDLFKTYLDEIFIRKDNNLDEQIISDATQLYVSGNFSIRSKKMFLKLKGEYTKINNLNDYKAVQDKLYGGKTRYQIIKFELARIAKNLKKYDAIMAQVDNIDMIVEKHKTDLSDDLYKKLASVIIMIELELGIKIGLFSELVEYFEEEVKKIRSCDLPDNVYGFRK